MARIHVTAGRPSMHAAPLLDHLDEDVFDWLRRQNNPEKIQPTKKGRPAGTGRPEAHERTN